MGVGERDGRRAEVGNGEREDAGHTSRRLEAPIAVSSSLPLLPCGRKRSQERWGGRTRGKRRGSCRCRLRSGSRCPTSAKGAGPDPQICKATYVSKGISTPLVLKEVEFFRPKQIKDFTRVRCRVQGGKAHTKRLDAELQKGPLTPPSSPRPTRRPAG